jgi:predicted metal-binding membrane protein
MDRRAQSSALERVLRWDRATTLVALLAASLIAWAYIAAGIGMDMEAMSMPDMVMPADWTPARFGLMFAMWAIMMVAMMLPSAAPMVLLFATIERRRRAVSPFPATASFASAYVTVWMIFSIAATVFQWQLDRLALLTPVIATANSVIASIALIAAGAYQFTPLKQACLRRCRSPLEFISRHWRRGPFGIGLLHGLYCLGCCWMLMLVLFVGGVMNLACVALIASVVLIEKLMPQGQWVGYAVGLVLIGGGLWLLLREYLTVFL